MDNNPSLTTQRLHLRLFTLADGPAVQRLVGEKEIALNTANIPHPYEEGMAESWINRSARDYEEGKLLNFAMTLRTDGSLIGAVGLVIKPEQAIAELGYWVGKPWWGQGYATEAALATVVHGFRELDLSRIYAQCFSRNPASTRVLEKAGMVKEGHLRKHFKKWDEFVDIEVYGVLREEHGEKP